MLQQNVELLLFSLLHSFFTFVLALSERFENLHRIFFAYEQVYLKFQIAFVAFQLFFSARNFFEKWVQKHMEGCL